MAGQKQHDETRRRPPGDEEPYDGANPTPAVEGHRAAVRGTSITPGEAGSRDTDSLVGEDLTGRPADKDEAGVRGRLGGETAGGEDVSGGTAMDEFEERGEPRLRDRDW